ncbi:hypothetical protein KEM60_02386 [Austwickia sp. TVS 96-490-7B]|nr:hypothetical protein [Austwickia sp. TVS 96-490-7B]
MIAGWNRRWHPVPAVTPILDTMTPPPDQTAGVGLRCRGAQVP